ncbi:outer membrane assembly lipoprotein YfiO [Limihaloglobus sulfuriphilus]|uniref:Outer membrane assembly lipoprotein YfiO n=1 Tax=Limihaloglobus sulfuriphilus TaxID=1851148 RepID=A0A1Q2MF98_9BACT|nr:tetratricopeptide repeat protein [Limihaloglobus sulfuriphilus]AQQ71373.1 outer membrane assembly lipoprotein YfiO [Limihaloglobus sulfuriphilus]
MSDLNTNDKAIVLFQEAIELLSNNFYIDGISKFKEIIALDPAGDLADDAQFNIGLCYMKMNAIKQAIENFQKVIDEYPDSIIAFSEQNLEYGRTPAKAYLGLLTCYIQLGNQIKVKECLEELKDFQDSYVVITSGKEEEKILYYELAKQAIEKSK